MELEDLTTKYGNIDIRKELPRGFVHVENLEQIENIKAKHDNWFPALTGYKKKRNRWVPVINGIVIKGKKPKNKNKDKYQDYYIDCTGDCVVGDEIVYHREIWEGNYPNSKFVGTVRETATIIKDSYGKLKQQHTFTLKLKNGENKRIKGRVLYRHGVFRKEWENEIKREEALKEKHNRGNEAREKRRLRKQEYANLY